MRYLRRPLAWADRSLTRADRATAPYQYILALALSYLLAKLHRNS